MANAQSLRRPFYVDAWRRHIRRYPRYRAIQPRCLVRLADGKPCGRPATAFDEARGHVVCWYHRCRRREVQ